MKMNQLLAVAVLTVPAAAFAHPGHGTVPVADVNGKPHQHFAKPLAPAAAPRATPSADKRDAKPAKSHTTPVSDQALGRER